jgi:hypothetical protein
MRKAMQAVRTRHFPISEVQDDWSNGEATQVHHIFPKSTHPQLAAVRENLILLTATQHYSKAHPGNKTSRVNKKYQIACLLAKIESIRVSGEESLFYSKAGMLNVLEIGLGMTFGSQESWEEIQKRLSLEIA